MKKTIHMTLVGISLLLAGIFILVSEEIGINYAKKIVPMLFALAGVFNVLYARANMDHKLASQFQLIQGIGLLVFAVVIAFLADGLTNFLMLVASFMLVLGLFEIVVSFSVVNSKTKILMKMLFFRLAAGFITAFGAVILLITTFSNENEGLVVAGVLTALIGLSNILYAAQMKILKTKNGK